MDLRSNLRRVLDSVGPENIWRPVHDQQNALMHDGIVDRREATEDDLSLIDFKDKTVLDIGCNFGHFSFIARKLGARKVIGLDIHKEVLEGAAMLQAMRNIDGVEFMHGDFRTCRFTHLFDIVLLVSFIGKNMIRNGLESFLDAAARLSAHSLVISAKRYYRISKHFPTNSGPIFERYDRKYIKKGDFLHLIDYLEDYYQQDWSMTVLSPDFDEDGLKRTLLFTRR